MYAEIRNDYMCTSITDEEGDMLCYVTIDGWKTDNDNEEGTVIATVILTQHHDICVVWNDNGARASSAVMYYINDAKERLQKYLQLIHS